MQTECIIRLKNKLATIDDLKEIAKTYKRIAKRASNPVLDLDAELFIKPYSIAEITRDTEAQSYYDTEISKPLAPLKKGELVLFIEGPYSQMDEETLEKAIIQAKYHLTKEEIDLFKLAEICFINREAKDFDSDYTMVKDVYKF